MQKIRVNITLDKDIHEKSKYWSHKEGKSLSENIESMLHAYNQERNELRVSEPIPPYSITSNSPLQDALLEIFIRLHPENQSELLQFAEYLNSKNLPNAQNSVKGVLKGKLKMSEDFDAPLDTFKAYMP